MCLYCNTYVLLVAYNLKAVSMQTAMAIMAELEERLLRLSDFEDIITCLKSEPANWSDDKMRGVLTAAYLSSVSAEEICLASESVTGDAADAALADAAPELTQHLAPRGGDSGSSPTAHGDAAAGAVAQRAGDTVDASAGHVSAPDEAADPLQANEGAGQHHGRSHQTSSIGVTSLELDELVKSELTQLQWTEAADDGDSGADAAERRTPIAMDAERMKQTLRSPVPLGRRSDGVQTLSRRGAGAAAAQQVGAHAHDALARHSTPPVLSVGAQDVHAAAQALPHSGSLQEGEEGHG